MITNFKYTSRKDKPEYVWRKYKEILTGRILDVGADECGLKKFLPEGTEYVGIGLSGSVDIKIDIEKGKLPYNENSFDCVLCLDVLEHIDNLHEVFDELCRVSKRHLIVSMPNSWRGFMNMLMNGYYERRKLPMKFYNLQVHPQKDRHKWFYSAREAEEFLIKRGGMNGMEVIQIDREFPPLRLKDKIYRAIFKIIAHKDVDIDSLWSGNIWALFRKAHHDNP